MNQRPVVLPGITLGVIALAALTGFANLPKEGGSDSHETVTAAAPLKASDQITACRGWNASVASAGLDAQLVEFKTAAGKGTIPDELQQQYLALSSSITQVLGQTAASAQVAQPISLAFRHLASGFKALETGVNDPAKVTAALTSIDDAQGELDTACAKFDG